MFDWIADFFVWLMDGIASMFQWLLSGIEALFMNFIFTTLNFFLSLLPDASINLSTVGAGGLPQFVRELLSVVSIFINLNVLGLCLLIMLSIEMVLLIISAILFIKRFIPFVSG